MIFVETYFAVLTLCMAYVLGRGGTPERLVAIFFLVSSVATALVPWHSLRFEVVSWGIVWLDVALFCAVMVIALLADRFWPLWIAALQFIAIAVHGVRSYDAKIVALAYWLISGKIAYLMILILVIGTRRHRSRRARGFPEFAWTAQRRRHDT